MPIQIISAQAGIEYSLSWLHQAAFPEEKCWKPDDFKMLLALPTHFVCLYRDAETMVQGFLLYSKILDEAEIITFAVNPFFQGQGVGTAIMKGFLAAMKKEKIRSVFLEVAENNKKAYSLYRFFGFQTKTVRTDYYGKNKDAFLMLKELF